MFSALLARIRGRRPETHGANYAEVCHCDFGLYCLQHPHVFLDDELLARDDWDEQKGAEVTPLFTRCIHGRRLDTHCPPCDDVYPVYRPSA